MRSWVADLIKVQSNLKLDSNLESESFWVNYEKTMQFILDKMKADAKLTGLNYINIEKEIKTKYPGLNYKATSCLAIAEYLYKVNKDSFIDFAPIVVEYTKVFEIELNDILNCSPYKTLGELIYMLKQNKSSKWNIIIDALERIRQIRNGSAHTGLSTFEKVTIIRNIMFKERTLDYILNKK